MKRLALEASHSRNDGPRAAIFLAAGVLVVGGIAGAVVDASLLPTMASLFGVALFVWLFRTQPQMQHVEYIVIDDAGIMYVHAPGSTGRVSRYAWSEIKEVAVALGEHGAGAPGLILKTNRPHLGGVPVFLNVFSDQDAAAAHRAANEWLHHKR